MARRRKRRRHMLGAPTAKDFSRVATILCHHRAGAALVQDFSSFFREQNPRFDAARFEIATRSCRR